METINLPGNPDLSLIDDIPWIELSHAYGAAIDVPEQIQRLVDADDESRGKLLWSFTSNLFHQGSVYPATVAAIPIFQQLLRYQSVGAKPLILELLANFAVGYPEDMHRNVELHEFVGYSKRDYARANDEDGRECYLGVAAGMPLYEALLDDDDPKTVISASYLIAFFPAHAFTACRKLLSIAADDSREGFVRCSAMISCSYLSGGVVKSEFIDLLSQLIVQRSEREDGPVSMLSAIAAYCVLRFKQKSIEDSVRTKAQAIAEQILKLDIDVPNDGVYCEQELLDADDMIGFKNRLFGADPQFPWGDPLMRLKKLVGKASPALTARNQQRLTRRQRQRLDPSVYDVRPNEFDRENVLAAVHRMHAWLDAEPNKLPAEAIAEFEPFKAHVDLVWKEVEHLLNSDDRFIHSAATSLVSKLHPLSRSSVESLLTRLHNGKTDVDHTLKKQSFSEQQVQDICDRLTSGRFVPGFENNQQSYREIVCTQGTDEQIWQLFNDGEPAEQCYACRVLIHRKLLDEHDPRVYHVQAADCMSSDPGRCYGARFDFAKSKSHQVWLFSEWNNIERERRWAVVDAMENFCADLSPLQSELLAKINAEETLLLKAKLIRLMSFFNPVTENLLRQLLIFSSDGSPPIIRSAIANTLGNWLGRNMNEQVIAELLKLTSDQAHTVRRVALNILARGHGPEWRKDDGDKDASLPVEITEATEVLGRALDDASADIRRLAIFHLFRRNELTSDLAIKLRSRSDSDRIQSELILAVALSPQPRRFDLQVKLTSESAETPLTSSVSSWAIQRL